MKTMSKSTPTTTDSHTDRFERFVALNAGEFWQVTSDTIEQPQIDRGDILLITNIDYVDEQAHTITVRIHPSKQSLDGNYELTPTLTEAINSDQAHGQKTYFDTIAAACEFISSKHVNYIGDGSSYEKVYYVESEDFPRHWETRDGTQHPAILAWQLER